MCLFSFHIEKQGKYAFICNILCQITQHLDAVLFVLFDFDLWISVSPCMYAQILILNMLVRRKIGSHFRTADVSIFLTMTSMSVVVCCEKEPGLETRHADTHSSAPLRGGGVGVGRASSGLIKSSGDRGRVSCLPAIFRSPALPIAVQLFSQIQIPARDTDIYNCHSCLPKCETPAEQPNDFLFLGSGLKLFLLFLLFWLVHHQLQVQFYVSFNNYCFVF